MVNPTNQFEGRKWNYYNSSRRDWWPIKTWPLRIQKIALKRHKDNWDRLNFTWFLLMNGLHEKKVRDYLFFLDNYDKSAINQINCIIKNRNSYNYTYYDLISRQLETPQHETYY